MGQIILCVWHM